MWKTRKLALVLEDEPRMFGENMPPNAVKDERHDMWSCSPTVYLYEQFPHKEREHMSCYPGLYKTPKLAKRAASVYLDGVDRALTHMGYEIAYGQERLDMLLRWAEQEREEAAQLEETRIELETELATVKTKLKQLAA